MRQRQVPAWLSGSLVVGAFGLLWLMERRRPLRPSVEPKLRHAGRNVALAGLAAASLQLLERPLIQPLTTLVEKRKLGLLKSLRLPTWLEVTLAVVLMDYSLYLWHVLMHRVPFLWRFHLPHHVDLDLVFSMPFVEQRSTWLLPNDGRPQRLSSLVERNQLLP